MFFVLNRNHTHRSTLGHIITFVKGEPCWVPPVMEKEVTAIGAEPVDGQKIDMLPPEVVEEVPLTPAEREERLFNAFEILVARNQRGDFNAQGLPNTKVLQTLTDLSEINSMERNEAWQKWREKKAA